MAFVPATNVIQVEVRGTFNGQEVEVTQYFQSAGAVTLVNVEDLFDWYETTWLPDWLTELSDGLAIDELYATDLTTSTSPTYTRSITPPQTGTHAVDPLPGSVAACISFRTGGRGRSTRGRNYVPGLSEDVVNGNDLDLTTLNNMVAAYELFMGGGTFPIAWTWGVLSRFFNLSPRVTGLFQPIIDVLSTTLTVESHRGRLK